MSVTGSTVNVAARMQVGASGDLGYESQLTIDGPNAAVNVGFESDGSLVGSGNNLLIRDNTAPAGEDEVELLNGMLTINGGLEGLGGTLGTVDIHQGVLTFLADQNGNDISVQVQGWINNGNIEGYDGAAPLNLFVDPTNNSTIVTAIPEPATLALLGLGLLSLAGVRRTS